MSKNLNVIFLEGNLTKDPEYGETSTGAPMARFTVANDRSFLKNGKWEKDTNFINIVCWGNTADLVQQRQLGKGYRVRIQGRIDQASLTSKEGNRFNSISIIAQTVDLLSKPKSAEENQSLAA